MSEPSIEPVTEPPDGLEANGRETSTPLVALLAAVVLGLAAILTAWGSFQDARVSGDVVKFYAEQQSLTASANDIYAQSDLQSQLEQQFFLSFAINLAEDNAGATEYLLATMSPELADVVSWWADQPDETIPPTPFVEENPAFANLPSQLLIADGLATMDQAEGKRVEAEEADKIGDRFGLANVFFAIVLFLAGITTLLSRRRLQVGILALGFVTMAIGIVILVTTPGWTTLS